MRLQIYCKFFNIRNLLLSAMFTLFSFACSKAPADGTYHIQIYATNDIHGRFFDEQYSDHEAKHPFSLASISSYMAEIRKDNKNSVVLLDIGDHLQGDNAVFYYNFVDTVSLHIFPKIVDYMKYDAVVVGNHDIETGHPVYDRVRNELKVPYLAANALSESSCLPYFEPYILIERNGIKIAVIGMTNTNIPNWLPRSLWQGMKFEEITPLMKYYVEIIRERERPHLIVVAVHSGLGEEDSDSMENSARYLAAHIKGIDVVFAAHDHRTTSEKQINGQDSVLVLEGGSRASSLSYADITIEIKKGEVVSKTIEGEIIPMTGIAADPEYLELFEAEYKVVKDFTNRKIGVLNKTISSRDAFFGSSDYMSLIHRVQIEFSNADISLAAPLSYDVSIEGGNLDYQDLMKIYPYENQLFVMEMTGREIKDYLEFSYSKWVNRMTSPADQLLLMNSSEGRVRLAGISYNFDSAAGIIYEVDVTRTDGERINIISMSDGENFDMGGVYKVAMSSYRASGGGGLLEYGAGIPKEIMESRIIGRYADIRSIVYNYLKDNGVMEVSNPKNWKFIPKNLTREAVKRDRKILFGEE